MTKTLTRLPEVARCCPRSGAVAADRRWRAVSRLCLMVLLLILIPGCSPETTSTGGERGADTENGTPPKPAPAAPREPLPEGIEWLTNDSAPVFADPGAQRGGTLHQALASFPLTFRVVGPDSNTSFRSAILGNQLSLTGIHPNTLNIIPELATHWAFGHDKKTMYFKINPKARWSDGVPVTADDFAYTLDFMRSPYIVAPWYNDYYASEIDRVVVFDDHTLAVVGAKAQPDLHLKISISPTPRHFFDPLGEDFIRRTNWAVVPNTGPYQIDRFKKGRYVRFARKEGWWGDGLRYFKHRFNVETVLFKVIRDPNLQWEYFKKGKLDVYPATIPQYWHIKTRTPVVEKGYVHKMWFFNDTPQSAMGLWMNMDRDIFKDVNLRYAFAHAMNVEKVITQVLRNDYFRLESAYVGYGPYTNSAVRARRYDIGKVAAYMTRSGWARGPDGIWEKNGRRFSVEVVYYRDDHTGRLVVLKEEAKKAGIELQLLKLDPSTAFKKILEKRHDVAWLGWSTGLRPHFWEFWHSANAHKGQTNNVTNTDDPEMDGLIDAYRNSLDETERIDLAHRIQVRVHEIGAYVPTFMVPYFREVYWRWWRLPDPPATRTSGSLFDPFGSGSGGLFWFDPSRYEQTRRAMADKIAFDPVTAVDRTYKP
ncbi:ABC transporter substrate-binding protein [Desulfosarcina alkanivorans]|uniref:ABC transporter substrate-binding protein n=1 Tax=Desulfosarcina alkanivorans TaxID=571177 RepID=A0A5K7YWU4_9BACT|nr:extracellular solute-binding protein [Desulfosarcina alkanivorans]BBO72443.1 ABC transporter substrate-binding protein [Desulfosarcina alkanivorans]